MISLSVPFAIFLLCGLGFITCGRVIGKESSNWDVCWFILNVVNFLGWIILLLFSLLVWELCK